MLSKSLNQVNAFLAGDKTVIKELLHPKNDGIPLAYSLAHASLAPGEDSLPHLLKGSEVYFVLQGTGTVWIDGESKSLRVGDFVYIPPRANQHICNDGEEVLRFLCIVSPAWSEEEEEVF
ncbi:MAG: cupin domain-containing protein [Bacteroidota bacterium]